MWCILRRGVRRRGWFTVAAACGLVACATETDGGGPVLRALPPPSDPVLGGAPSTLRWESSVRPRGIVADCDGDGRPELAVGAPSDRAHRGSVFVFAPPVAGAVTLRGSEREGETFGEALSFVGDVDGDGYGDLAVGAPSLQSDRVGRVYLFLGGEGGLGARAPTTLQGSGEAELFGASLAGLGDVDRDGYGDLAVGAPDADGFAGRVYVFHGGPGGVRGRPTVIPSPEARGAAFGMSVAGVGDFEGEGSPELAVGAPYVPRGALSVGRVYGYSLRAGASLARPSWVLSAPDEGADAPGAVVAGAGDLNGDGLPEVLLGVVSVAHGAGRAYVFPGGPRGPDAPRPWVLRSPRGAEGDHLGASVAGAGDLDGDGYGDVVVGAPGGREGAFGEGRALVFLGGPEGPGERPAATLSLPTVPLSRFGRGVASVGDFDGDGLADLAVGAPGAWGFSGRVALHRGAPEGVERAPWRTLESPGGEGGGEFGLALSGGR